MITANGDSRPAYYVSSEAWYWKGQRSDKVTDEIMVTREALNSEGGHDGCHWEFSVTWEVLGNDPKPACRVAVFDDAFAAFTEIPEFFSAMAAFDNPSPAVVKAVLDGFGFTDTTAREMPARVRNAAPTASDMIDFLATLRPDTPVTVGTPDGRYLNVQEITDPTKTGEPSAVILTSDDFDTRQF